MASSATCTPLSLSSSSSAQAPPPPPPRQLAATATATATSSSPSQCVTLPPTVHQTSRLWKTSAFCRKFVRNVAAMATTGEAPPTVVTTTIEVEETVDLPDFVKTLQDTWDKVDDKYAVTSLGVAGFVGLWVSAGMISAVDRLPLVPGVLELVGIGYTGWFVYKNLIFQPEREALIQKIKDIYEDIIGTS